jgi:hypothetical protein
MPRHRALVAPVVRKPGLVGRGPWAGPLTYPPTAVQGPAGGERIRSTKPEYRLNTPVRRGGEPPQGLNPRSRVPGGGPAGAKRPTAVPKRAWKTLTVAKRLAVIPGEGALSAPPQYPPSPRSTIGPPPWMEARGGGLARGVPVGGGAGGRGPIRYRRWRYGGGGAAGKPPSYTHRPVRRGRRAGDAPAAPSRVPD